MNFNAFGLESSRTPSYARSSGAATVSGGPATMESVTTTETKVTKVEEDKKEEQVAQEVAATAEEQKQEQQQEQQLEQNLEQKLVEAEAVAEE